MLSMMDIRKNPIHGSFLSLGLFAFLAGSAKADVVVLRTGTEIQGTVANREQVATSPGLFSNISILIEREGHEPSLQRIAVADILYVLLEDGATKRVVEFSDFQQIKRLPKAADHSLEYERKDNPIAITFVGIGMCLVGALVKLGDDEIVIRSGVTYKEKTYNAINYGFMVVGGVLILVGLAMKGPLDLSSSYSEVRTFSGTHFNISHRSRTVELGYCIRY